MDATGFDTLTELLDPDGFEVVEAASDRAAKLRRLTVAPTTMAALCPHCGAATAERHACHERAVVDLPPGGWRTELLVRLSQFRCDGCGKLFTPRAARRPGRGGARATERFPDRLAEYATHGEVSAAAAARFLGVAEKTAEGWYDDYLKRPEAQEADAKPIRSPGIDELSLKKDAAGSSAC
jgi:transposase